MAEFIPEEIREEAAAYVGSAIDTHVHFWKYNKDNGGWITDDMKILRQDYLPEQIALSLKRNQVEGCVAVQVDQTEGENYYLLELSKTHSLIRGVVGWVDLRADNLPDRLAHFADYSIIKGYRHIVQTEPDDFLADARFRRGVQTLRAFDYTYDLLVYHRQLPAALDFVQHCHSQRIVLDHCAKPDIRNKEINNWRQWIKEIAQCPHVFCKLSGLLTEAGWKTWSAADFYPYLDTVFEAFGPDRLMYGSDWPVMLLSGIYVQWKSLLEKYMEGYSPDDKEKVFKTNAIEFYHC